MGLDLKKSRRVTITLNTKHLFWPFMFFVWGSLITSMFLVATRTEVAHSGTMITKYTEVQSSEYDSEKIETVYRAIVADSNTQIKEEVNITAVTYHTSTVGTVLNWTESVDDNPFWGGFFIVCSILIWPIIMIFTLMSRVLD